MFGQQSDKCRHDATRSFMNMKMKKNVSVREHVLDMINILHDAEIHGATIDERTQVSVILESLTPAFATFTTNYVMNKLEYNMTQLLNELQTFESLNKSSTKVEEANVAETKPSTSNGNSKKRKGGQGKDKKKDKQLEKTNKSSKKNNYAKNSKKKAPKGECLHCGVDSHWKRNCPMYLAELKEKKKGKFDLLILGSCLVEGDLSS